MNGFFLVRRKTFDHLFVKILQRFVRREENFTDLIMQLVSTLQERRIDLISGDLQRALGAEVSAVELT